MFKELLNKSKIFFEIYITNKNALTKLKESVFNIIWNTECVYKYKQLMLMFFALGK